MFKITLVSDSKNEKIFEAVWDSIQEVLNDYRFEHESTADIVTTGIFDPTTETFDDAAANALVGREHRKGFELPKV